MCTHEGGRVSTLRNFTWMKLCCWFVREQNPAPHFLLSNRRSVSMSSLGKENVADFIHLELLSVLTRPPSHLRRINQAHVSGFDHCNCNSSVQKNKDTLLHKFFNVTAKGFLQTPKWRTTFVIPCFFVATNTKQAEGGGRE